MQKQMQKRMDKTQSQRHKKTPIAFMSVRRLAALVSMALILVALLALVVRGLNLGLDFAGGMAVELHYSSKPDLGEMRNKLADAGYQRAVVQSFGSDQDVLVRLPDARTGDQDQSVRLIRLLQQDDPELEVRRNDFIGAQFGAQLKEQGVLAMVVAMVVAMIYVAFRFQFKFAVGAVMALVHDVVMVLGVFALFDLNFDLTVLVAVLVVIGYSLNDTLVVCDRIRENFRKLRQATAEEVMNVSINQVLGRTLITSLTTLLVLVVLFLFGGQAIWYFSLALIIGVVTGTYSSIYIAANVMLWAGICRQDLVPAQEERDTVLHNR